MRKAEGNREECGEDPLCLEENEEVARGVGAPFGAEFLIAAILFAGFQDAIEEEV